MCEATPSTVTFLFSIDSMPLSHGREICDRRYAHVDNAAEEGKQLPGGLKSERHLAQVVKDYDRQAAEMRKTRDPSVESKINGPFVHNLPKRKPATRNVFTFRVFRALMVLPSN